MAWRGNLVFAFDDAWGHMVMQQWGSRRVLGKFLGRCCLGIPNAIKAHGATDAMEQCKGDECLDLRSRYPSQVVFSCFVSMLAFVTLLLLCYCFVWLKL